MNSIKYNIYIGNSNDGRDAGKLRENNITSVLNVAFDLDFTYEPLSDVSSRFFLEYAKVGLQDGVGNLPTTLVAAVLTLRQLLERTVGVLVVCHEGKSRSVVVIATYIAYMEDISIEKALQIVKRCHMSSKPNGHLVALAERALTILKSINL